MSEKLKIMDEEIQTIEAELDIGYYEPCSRYRACVGLNGEHVVEAVRVKTICVTADEEEAKRIADALNFTSGNIEYTQEDHN